MSYEKKVGDGILFKNDRKETEKHPDYKGDILLEDGEHWLAAWIKTGKKGKFMTLSIGGLKGQSAPNSQQGPKQDDFEDQDIPF